MQAQIIEDQQVRREKGPEAPLQGVVDPGLVHCPEVIVGMDESDSVAGADG